MKYCIMYLLMFLTFHASSQVIYTFHTAGNWSDSANWSPSYPGTEITLDNYDIIEIQADCNIPDGLNVIITAGSLPITPYLSNATLHIRPSASFQSFGLEFHNASILNDGVLGDGQFVSLTSPNGNYFYNGNEFNGDLIQGDGVLQFVNLGALSPGGASVGAQSINITECLSLAHYQCNVNGVFTGIYNNDIIQVSNCVDLSYSNLYIDWGFTPSAGQSFDLLTHGSRVGTFGAIDIPPVPGLEFNIDYSDPNRTVLRVTATISNDISNNVGIDTPLPQSKLHLGQGDIFLEEVGAGVIMKSPDGACWKLQVSNNGAANFTSVECPNTGTIEHGDQIYGTKLMPDGRWWMTENLNIGTMINSLNTPMTNNNIIEKWCNNNDTTSCELYGALYTWNEMMQYTTTEGNQGICPTGWHIPTNAEWLALFESLPASDRGSRLSGNTELWENGVLRNSPLFGASGFKNVPGGWRISSGGCINQGIYSNIWSSTSSSGDAYMCGAAYDWTGVETVLYPKNLGLSVRCIKD